MSLKIAQGFMNLSTKEVDCVLRSLTIFAYVSRHTKRNPVKKCHHRLAEASAEKGVGVSAVSHSIPLKEEHHIERESLSFSLTCGEAMPSPKQRGSTRLALAQADMKPTN